MIYIVYFNRLQYQLYYTNKYYQHELFSIFTLNNVAKNNNFPPVFLRFRSRVKEYRRWLWLYVACEHLFLRFLKRKTICAFVVRVWHKTGFLTTWLLVSNIAWANSKDSGETVRMRRACLRWSSVWWILFPQDLALVLVLQHIAVDLFEPVRQNSRWSKPRTNKYPYFGDGWFGWWNLKKKVFRPCMSFFFFFFFLWFFCFFLFVCFLGFFFVVVVVFLLLFCFLFFVFLFFFCFFVVVAFVFVTTPLRKT